MTTDCSWNYHEQYCGLIDTKIRASDKDLPVHVIKGVSDLEI